MSVHSQILFNETIFRAILANDPDGIIRKLLPQLERTQFDYLIDILCNLVNNIISLFHIEKPNDFRQSLLADKGRDIISLFLLLLPFIENKDDVDRQGDEKENLTKLQKLEDLYVKKEMSHENDDISKVSPRYKYMNIQYNRCVRPHTKNDTPIERPFDISHIEHNYILLLQTIQQIANRLYVNWTNIVPITNYKKHQIYSDTVNAIKNHTISDTRLQLPPKNITYTSTRQHIVIKSNHLYVGTIYETVYHQLYKKIKNVKWLLYNISSKGYESMTSMSTIPTIIEIFKNSLKLDMKYLFEGKQWEKITKIEQDKFTDTWKQLYQNNNKPISVSVKISILHSFIIFFEKYSHYDSNENDDFKEYKKLSDTLRKIKKGEGDDDDETLYFTEELEFYVKHYDKIKTQYIYNYLSSVLKQFRNTVYYKILYDEEFIGEHKLKLKKPNPPQFLGKPIDFMIKNLFNFAKSICCYDKTLIEMPERWVSMDKDMRKIFIDRLNDTNRNDIVNKKGWFWIRKNIERIYPFTFSKMSGIEYEKFINDANTYIYDTCMINLTMFVCECLTISGTLSEFRIFTSADKGNENIDSFKKCNYFLTEEPYEKLEVFIKSADGEPEKTIKYNEFNTRYMKKDKITGTTKPASQDSKWYDTYAMNWVSQINFFHKYLNNRVIFATGGTGVGKSTQLPKLLLYATKMIDCKDNGRVIDSQPRKRPTRDVAVRIALEMGVSIYTGEGKEEKDTDNYHIQYRHQDSRHVLERTLHPVLRFVTDKILSNTITNPLYKATIQNITTKESTYTQRNVFDIVIVDESHEHNKNMDMILTMMRDVLYYNNDCKLVIVSATMADDEPVYRRFYRDINDNLMYPLNIHNAEQMTDRINVDRRLDISIPGQPNNWYIDEKYMTDVPENDALKNKYIADLVNKILTRKDAQDILVFQPGRKEIMACAKIIRDSTDESVIAIPYYGDLSEDLRKLVEEAPKDKASLKINRDDIDKFESISDVSQLHSVGGHYKHVVIIATSIAEASITIDTLTDVIDTGTRKTPEYSPQFNGSVLRKDKISEQSHTQRRGRVGRKMNGYAHYLYSIDEIKGKKPSYDICVSDITDIIFSLLRNSTSKVMFDSNSDPNTIPDDKTTDINFNDAKYAHIQGLGEIIKSQYYIRKKITTVDNNVEPIFERFTYVGDDSQYDYKNKRNVIEQYTDGYDVTQLKDDSGTFYIVHPNEMDITRNILGVIQEKMKPKIILYLRKLFDMMLITRDATDKKKVFKTLYGEQINNLSHNAFLDANSIQFTIACCFASAFGCLDDVVKIITMLLYTSNKNQQITPQRKCKSDLFYLLDFFNNMLSTLPCFVQNKSDIQQNFGSGSKSIELNLVKLEQCINGTNTLNNLQNMDDERDKKFLENVGKYVGKVIPKNANIMQECIRNYVDTLMTFLSVRSNIKLCSQYLNKSYIDTVAAHYTREDRITASFLHAFGYNIVVKISGTSLYLPIKYPTDRNIKKIKSTKNILSTYVDPAYLSNYLLYINILIGDDEKEFVNSSISALHYIDPKLLNIISYQYNLQGYINTVLRGNPSSDIINANLNPDDDKKLIVGTQPPYNIIRKYDMTVRQMIQYVTYNYLSNTSQCFTHIYPNSEKILQQYEQENQDFLYKYKKIRLDE
jgi:hypothetical protein